MSISRFPTYAVLLFLIVYLPFEDFLLKWAPVSDSLFGLLRLGSEALIYLTFFAVILNRIAVKKTWRRTPVDILLAALVGATLVGVLLYQAPLTESLLSIRPLARYFAVFYIVVNIGLSDRQLATLLRSILVLGILQGALAVVQYLAGPGFNQLFLPRASDLEIAGQSRSLDLVLSEIGLKEGSVVGTFGLPTAMAAFLLIALVITLTLSFIEARNSRLPGLTLLLAAGLILFGIFATLKRAPLLLGASLPLIVLPLLGRRVYLSLIIPLYVGVLLFLSLAVVGFTEAGSFEGLRGRDARSERIPLVLYVSNVFSRSYWEGSGSNSRLWFIREAGGYLINPFRGSNLVGYTPHDPTARVALVAKAPHLELLSRYLGSKDVFWVSTLFYYGIVGILAFAYTLFRLFRQALGLLAASDQKSVRLLAVTFCAVVIISIPFGFIVRLFLLRSFSFYFWLLAGLVSQQYVLQVRSRGSA